MSLEASWDSVSSHVNIHHDIWGKSIAGATKTASGIMGGERGLRKIQKTDIYTRTSFTLQIHTSNIIYIYTIIVT